MEGKSARKRVQMKAGDELLNKYQQDWKMLHENAVSAAFKAKKVDVLIKEAYGRVTNNDIHIEKLCKHINGLVNMLDDVENISANIARLEGSLEEVSTVITAFESICQQHSICAEQLKEMENLNQLKLQKRLELEEKKEVLAKDHSTKLAEVKSKHPEIFQSRQEALKQALAGNENFE
ncbi:dysbindin-like [Ciona intestinalis]